MQNVCILCSISLVEDTLSDVSYMNATATDEIQLPECSNQSSPPVEGQNAMIDNLAYESDAVSDWKKDETIVLFCKFIIY